MLNKTKTVEVMYFIFDLRNKAVNLNIGNKIPSFGKFMLRQPAELKCFQKR